MTPAHCRTARALLDMTQPQLAEAAGLGLSTVVDYERTRRTVSPDAIAAIRRALEAAGVEFTNGNQPGVRLRKERVTTWENGKLVPRELDDDPVVDALVGKHSSPLVPDDPPQPEAVPGDPWRAAFGALMENEDVKPLANLLRSGSPVPPWVAQALAELLVPMRSLLIGNEPKSKETQLDLKNADRLVFVRTDTMRSKIRTHARKVATGLALMEAKADKKHKAAVEEVMKRLGASESPSYVEHAVRHAKSLPRSLRSTARKLDET
jgi:transcriptional regulator with XRE-family HTH domain